MMIEAEKIKLKGGSTFVTHRSTDAYRITDGALLVYIVPWQNGETGRRSLCYEANAGEVIPAFCYDDMDGMSWRFCFAAVEAAQIEVIENGATKVLQRKFAQKAGIRNFAMEGFCGGIVDQYRTNIVTEDSFIIRSQRERESTTKGISELIYSSFSRKRLAGFDDRTGDAVYDAAMLLCRRMHISIAPYEKVKAACPAGIQLSDIARVSHFSYRRIILEHDWYKGDIGGIIAFGEDEKTPYVCVAKGEHNYTAFNPETGESFSINSTAAAKLSPNAYMLYRSFPCERIGLKEAVRFCASSIRISDVLLMFILSVAAALIGLLTPIMNQKLYDEFIPLGAQSMLLQMGGLMASFLLANIMFSIVRSLSEYRMTSRMSYDVQNAVYDRVFNLPESFFRKYESADLSQRAMGAGTIVNSVASTVITCAVAFISFVVYLIKMGGYSASLMGIGLLMIAVYGIAYYLICGIAIKHRSESAELDGKANSVIYQLINGISKIRIAGVENRAVMEYLKPYVRLRNSQEKYTRILNAGSVLTMAADSIFSIVLYIVIIKSGMEISIGTFIAFTSVFGSFSAASMQIIGGLVQLKSLKPAVTRLKPVLEALPEYDEAKELPGDISGSIEISNVTFAYGEDSPNVLNGISLNIKPGEYVGVVGSSGCGKSTLLKLLLGFEKPVSGKVYYDNKDIESLDKRELRKKIGVVLQDGKLISGSIFENITITNPSATHADVEAVVKAVGLSDDIAAMPMGLNTILSENCGTISGGQQQRILIARALIASPRILLFDEATSALDNITQQMVCDSLDRINATRVVIAHRLSTIIKCDRIIVMDKGDIVEQGTYSELMERHGLFYQFASRQLA